MFDGVDVFDCAVADVAQAQIIQADKYLKKTKLSCCICEFVLLK